PWIQDPKTDPYRKHQVMYQLPGCDQARLSGVYLGEQRFTVSRAGTDVRVQHTGTFTYDARALGNGVRLPVHAVAHRTFVVHRFAAGWHLFKVVNARTSVAPGYGRALPRYTGPAGTPRRYRVREFFIGKIGDYREYSVADGDGHRYTQYDPRLVPEVAGIPADANPYVVLSVVSQLDTASPTPCQRADRSHT